MRSLELAVVGLSFGLASVAFAQNSGPPGTGHDSPQFVAMREACKADTAKLCAGKPMGACLAQNEARLSSGCKQARAKMSMGAPAGKPQNNPLFVAVGQACKADMAKYCAGKKGPQEGACMEANETKFSKPCKDAIHKLESATP